MLKAICLLFFVLPMLFTASCTSAPKADEVRDEALRQQREAEALPATDPNQAAGAEGAEAGLSATAQTTEICAGSPVPSGWIKVNDRWNPAICGKPTRIIYNVWTIQKYSDKPKGSTMTVCASAPIPNGWVVVATRWDPSACGHPNRIQQNMKTIRRLE